MFTDVDWFHCNVCGCEDTKPEPYVLVKCGHIVCNDCIGPLINQRCKCPKCGKGNSKFTVLDEAAMDTPEIKAFFTPKEDLLKEVLQSIDELTDQAKLLIKFMLEEVVKLKVEFLKSEEKVKTLEVGIAEAEEWLEAEKAKELEAEKAKAKALAKLDSSKQPDIRPDSDPSEITPERLSSTRRSQNSDSSMRVEPSTMPRTLVAGDQITPERLSLSRRSYNSDSSMRVEPSTMPRTLVAVDEITPKRLSLTRRSQNLDSSMRVEPGTMPRRNLEAEDQITPDRSSRRSQNSDLSLRVEPSPISRMMARSRKSPENPLSSTRRSLDLSLCTTMDVSAIETSPYFDRKCDNERSRLLNVTEQDFGYSADTPGRNSSRDSTLFFNEDETVNDSTFFEIKNF